MNHGPHALVPRHRLNATFLDHEEWLVSMAHDLLAMPICEDVELRDAHQELLEYVHREMDVLERVKMDQWNKQRDVSAMRPDPARRNTHWMARFLSRPDIEPMLDSRREQTVSQLPDVQSDVWDAPMFHEFKDAAGGAFIKGPKEEGRYLFSLSVDGFNPFQAKEAKQSVTVTGIYMVCLNLPPHIRYLPENTYLVGIIP
ncbi:uncharacterized protein B0H18DRAFT_882775, partial [Fomitopsis serialis]|uniref:uncharacterized protein n=1 Tax=Fomitopsis serialis TaxID=139415 RepID=UPI002008D5EC